MKLPTRAQPRDAALWREHSPRWAASLNRRATVEQWMFDAASGKRPMPTPAELREWALKLGTPDDALLRNAVGVSPSTPAASPPSGITEEGGIHG